MPAQYDTGFDYLTNALDYVQNRSARLYLANYSRMSSVTSMKLTLNLPNLCLRRQAAPWNLFHKTYHSNPIKKKKTNWQLVHHIYHHALIIPTRLKFRIAIQIYFLIPSSRKHRNNGTTCQPQSPPSPMRAHFERPLSATFIPI